MFCFFSFAPRLMFLLRLALARTVARCQFLPINGIVGMKDWEDAELSDRKEAISREIRRREDRGETFTPVTAPKGKKLAAKFWGQSWQRHLESYADYESRLPRGRSYLRNGQVYNLEIVTGQVNAIVAGEYLYEVKVVVAPLDAELWSEIKAACAGQISSMMDLLAGSLGDGAMKAILDRENGLFPEPRQIRVQCTCPDWADLCKHGAAVLYAVGLRFDEQPDTFFQLRGVDHSELLSATADALSHPDAGTKTIPDSDISALFGIELDSEDNR